MDPVRPIEPVRSSNPRPTEPLSVVKPSRPTEPSRTTEPILGVANVTGMGPRMCNPFRSAASTLNGDTAGVTFDTFKLLRDAVDGPNLVGGSGPWFGDVSSTDNGATWLFFRCVPVDADRTSCGGEAFSAEPEINFAVGEIAFRRGMSEASSIHAVVARASSLHAAIAKSCCLRKWQSKEAEARYPRARSSAITSLFWYLLHSASLTFFSTTRF